MTKIIVYLFILTSFIVGCGQGFEGNLSQVKDISPFKDESNKDQQSQDTNTTRPNNTEQQSGVGVVYGVDENNNNQLSNEFLINNNEIAVQGQNWSANQKPQNSTTATYTITNETPNKPSSDQTPTSNLNTNSQTEQVTNETTANTEVNPETKLSDNTQKPSDEGKVNIEDSTSSEPVVVTADEVNQKPEVQKSVVKQSKCSSFKLFDNHNNNIQNYVNAISKLLIYVKAPQNYNFSYKINCEVLNKNAGVIFTNFKKFDTKYLKVLSQNRPGLRSVKLILAETIKRKLTKSDKKIDINLVTNPDDNINKKNVEELADLIENSDRLPILISSQEAYDKWVKAIDLVK